jgi:argininosuccinate lyase
LDLALAPYDCTASIAHAEVLQKAGVLTAEETEKLVRALETLRKRCERGDFVIQTEEEDCHTAIENHLISELGELGKKIHTARSRNDQVVTAIRLYVKDRLNAVSGLVDDLVGAMVRKIEEAGEVALPGYTHTREAMPSSFSLWMGSFAESMEDNQGILDAALTLIDQNPLGSGAGYGIPLIDINRELSAKVLGFRKVQKNPLYVQNSRGKFEAFAVSSLVNIMADLNKLSTDLILFTMESFGFFSLPAALLTGSSIMPQKRNPDVLEIVRSAYHEVLAREFSIKSMVSNLISGYHRDFQRTKKPLMESFDITEDSLGIIIHVIGELKVNRAACERACTEELYATHEVYKQVRAGVPFRDAYRQVAKRLFPGDPAS